MIFLIFIIGFILGLIYCLVSEKLPLKIKDVYQKGYNSWMFNLFISVINGLILVISYYFYNFEYMFFASIVVSGLLLIIFMTDFKYMIILDSPLVISGLIIIILKWIYYGPKDALISLLSGLGLFILMLIIGFIGNKIFKKESLGGGDIKLSIIVGIILGFRLGLIALILSSFLALPYAITNMYLNNKKELPFGPFIVGSMTLIFIFSTKFMNLINLII